ncbi:MAG: AMP-binding protein [Candidatus Koribacter versatilis]|uniref:AMP-binding protein n=1 Tax=Candidatus Korobacter versatilis TaxID=658062 RepID=A0A932EP26_9BACT|nr:AMP-binding protein [Candidatus Koribacter versatilis]
MRTLSHPYRNVFLHDAVLDACSRFPSNTAIIDTSNDRRLTYAEYGDLVSRIARNFAALTRPGSVIAIYLANSWEFAAACHAATLAQCIPTPLNPSYREREVRYQLENSGAAILISDGPLIKDMDLAGLPALQRIFTTRQHAAGAAPFDDLLKPTSHPLPAPGQPASATLAALPYSSGTTGLPKGVMLSHENLVANAYQFIRPTELASPRAGEITLCFLPLYHIYGLNVILNPSLFLGATLVLMPRFDVDRACDLITRESITWLPMVPPVMNALSHAAEAGKFPRDHHVRYAKSGAAPLAPELPRRFTELTAIKVAQGYGMTEASPVTHVGFIEPGRYRPDTIGHPVAETRCKLRCDDGAEVDVTSPAPPNGKLETGDWKPQFAEGELLMRGPQFMLGYWNAPEATAAALRNGWYHSGDVARVDSGGFFQIVDRRKEMIKYNGFPIAPAEVEACLLEHPQVRDVGVIGRPDPSTGELPIAFVVLRDGDLGSPKLAGELGAWVSDRLTKYKQPQEVRFVASIPRNPSGKILRRDLRSLL